MNCFRFRPLTEARQYNDVALQILKSIVQSELNKSLSDLLSVSQTAFWLTVHYQVIHKINQTGISILLLDPDFKHVNVMSFGLLLF